MLDAVILYSLAIYMVFHVASRSDILAKPRGWVLRTLPGWLVYPLSCGLCFTFWLTLVGNLLGFVRVDLIVLFAAPVVNMVLDLVVRALIRANEPPVCLPAMLESRSLYAVCGGPVTAGQVAKIENGYIFPTTPVNGDGVKVIPNDPWWKTLGGIQPPVPYAVDESPPEGWEQVNRDSSLYRTSGIVRWWPGKLVGRKVRVVTGARAGQIGTIDNGDGPAMFRSGMDVTPWTYFIKPDVPVVEGPDDPHDGRIKVLARDCILLEGEGLPGNRHGRSLPFNPLNHEQTK